MASLRLLLEAGDGGALAGGAVVLPLSGGLEALRHELADGEEEQAGAGLAEDASPDPSRRRNRSGEAVRTPDDSTCAGRI